MTNSSAASPRLWSGLHQPAFLDENQTMVNCPDVPNVQMFGMETQLMNDWLNCFIFHPDIWLCSEATSLFRPGRESYTHACEDLKWRLRGKYGFWALSSMYRLKLKLLIDKRARYISYRPFSSSAFISLSECKIHDAGFCQPLGNRVSNEVNRKIPSAQTPGESKQQIKKEQTSESHLLWSFLFLLSLRNYLQACLKAHFLI